MEIKFLEECLFNYKKIPFKFKVSLYNRSSISIKKKHYIFDINYVIKIYLLLKEINHIIFNLMNNIKLLFQS